MDKLSKELILASSSGWVAALLNFLPGLGAGYLYQRRWFPYFLTSAAAILWFSIGILIQKNSDPSEIQQLVGLAGLLIISIFTSIESNIAYNRSKQLVEENSTKNIDNLKRKGWFRK